MTSKEINLKLLDLEIKIRERAILLCDQIINTIISFNGKKPTKRLDTALKKIDEDLHFYTHYNSFIIEFYIHDRFINVDNIAHYIKSSSSYFSIVHSSIYSSYGDGICQEGVINSDQLLKHITNSQNYYIKEIEKIKEAIENIDDVILQKQKIDKQMKAFERNVPYLVREYFNLKFK